MFTAGVAQSYVNLKNTMVGRNVVILGSGDIGMIMARRLTLEGCKVHAVFELPRLAERKRTVAAPPVGAEILRILRASFVSEEEPFDGFSSPVSCFQYGK